MSFDSFFVTLCDFLDSESPTFGNQMVPSEGSRGSEGESDVFLSDRETNFWKPEVRGSHTCSSSKFFYW